MRGERSNRIGTELVLLLCIGVSLRAAHGQQVRTTFIDPSLAFDSPNVLRIATALTLSHTAKYATLGGALKKAYSMYFRALNQHQGGVKIQGKTYLVELTLIDDSSLKDVVERITNYFIDQQNITILLGPYSSGLTSMVSPKVNETGAVLVAPCASLGSVFIGRPTVFGTLSPSSKFLTTGFEVLKNVDGGAHKTVAVVQEDKKWSKGVCSRVPALVQSAGNMQLLANGTFTVPDNAVEDQVKDVVGNLIALKPDIVVQCTYRIACHSLLRQMRSQRFEVKAVLATICVTEADFMDVLGTAGQYIIGVAPWTPDLPLTSELSPGWTAARFAAEYKAEFGGVAPYQAASAFGACEVLVKAIEDANSTDPLLIAAQLKIANHSTVYGRIAFDGNGQCTNEMKVVQFQFSPMKTVYPLENANGQLAYPKPTWAAMECANVDPNMKSRYGLENGSCQDCPVGTHSKVVNDTLGNPERRCLSCGAGKVGLDGEYQFCLDCSAGSFSASGSEQCTQCAAGRYQDQRGEVTCMSCIAGKSQKLTGKSQCISCHEGMYSEGGAESCTRCPVGQYTAVHGGGSTECSTCEDFLAGSSTLFLGASSTADCICMPGSYNGGPLHDTNRCMICTEGMKCDKAGLLRPNQSMGYYIRKDTVAYRCLIEDACPAGKPGQCNDGRVGLVCSQCPDDQIFAGGLCKDCKPFDVFLFCCVLIAIICSLNMIHHLSNDQLMVDVSNALALSVTLGMAVTTAQLMATFNQLPLPWPNTIKGFLKTSSFMIFDPGSISTECIFGASPETQYSLRVIVPYVLILCILMLYSLSHLAFMCLGRSKGLCNGRFQAWDLNKTLNTIGQSSQAVFIAIAAVAAMPFQCYTHPSGEQSVVTYPSVICSTEEHAPLICGSVMLLCTFVIPFLLLTFWANWKAPTKAAAMQLGHLVRFRFLFYRFRPNRWWWGSVVAIRQLLLAFTPMVQPDDPYAQIVYVLIVLLLYIVAVSILLPWKSHELNVIEITTLVLLVLFMSVMGAFVPITENNSAYTVLMIMCVSLILLTKIVVLFVASTGIVLKGRSSPFGSQYKASPEERLRLASTWHKFCSDYSSLDHAQIAQLFSFLSSFDRKDIERVMRASYATNTQALTTPPELTLFRISNIPTTSVSFRSQESMEKYWETASQAITASRLIKLEQQISNDDDELQQRQSEADLHSTPKQMDDELQKSQPDFDANSTPRRQMSSEDDGNDYLEAEAKASQGKQHTGTILTSDSSTLRMKRPPHTPREATKGTIHTGRILTTGVSTPRAPITPPGTPRLYKEEGLKV